VGKGRDQLGCNALLDRGERTTQRWMTTKEKIFLFSLFAFENHLVFPHGIVFLHFTYVSFSPGNAIPPSLTLQWGGDILFNAATVNLFGLKKCRSQQMNAE
jgi:hypothetical protein